MPACPICGGERFVPFHGRPQARCDSCGALERGRYQWLVYRRLVTLPEGAAVAHFAPERFFMEHFASRPDIRYRAFDLEPARYPHPTVVVESLDLCRDLPSLPAGGFDFVLHSHVLEHLPCDVGGVLAAMRRLLRPGGVMLFSAPFAGDTTIEDLDPALTPAERLARFKQEDHMRLFGKRDFMALVQEVLGVDCLVRQADHFDSATLLAAGIPPAAGREPNGRSVFLFRQPA